MKLFFLLVSQFILEINLENEAKLKTVKNLIRIIWYIYC